MNPPNTYAARPINIQYIIIFPDQFLNSSFVTEESPNVDFLLNPGNDELSNTQCTYTDIDKSNLALQQSKSNSTISFFSLNIQSLHSKYENLIRLMADFDDFATIIALQEIWSIGRDYPIPGYQEILYESRDRKQPTLNPHCGGGVALYVKEGLNFKNLEFPDQFVSGIYESQWIQLNTGKNCGIIIGNIYRHNSGILSNYKRAIKIHFNILRELKNNNKYKKYKVFFMGDFNLDLINFERDSKVGDFLDNCLDIGFLPCITKPTRITSNTATLIDHFYTNSNTVVASNILIDDLSDHYPVIVIDQIQISLDKGPKRWVSDFSKKNVQSLCQRLGNLDWNTVTDSENPQSAFDDFFEKISSAILAEIPLKEQKVKKITLRADWLTDGIKKSAKTKNKLFAKMKKCPSETNTLKYKNYKKNCLILFVGRLKKCK